MRVLLVAHPDRPRAEEAVAAARALLAARGHEAVDVAPDVVIAADGAIDRDLGPTPGLVVSFGGDGTFLRAARIARALDAPVVGVNVGRVGFLAGIDPADLERDLDVLLAGGGREEPRSTLEARILDADGAPRGELWALNEVAVEKVARQRLIRLEVSIAGTPFASLAADALIVATATGSTAYALSAGGPIVAPTLDATLVVPVAPHSLFDRTVVARPGDVVRIDLPRDQDGALVSADGSEPLRLPPGGAAEIRGGGRPVRVAQVGAPDFFGRVRRTFRLG